VSCVSLKPRISVFLLVQLLSRPDLPTTALSVFAMRIRSLQNFWVQLGNPKQVQSCSNTKSVSQLQSLTIVILLGSTCNLYSSRLQARETVFPSLCHVPLHRLLLIRITRSGFSIPKHRIHWDSDNFSECRKVLALETEDESGDLW